MTGIYQHTLDAKGRLFIPAKLREELGDTFYVTISPEKCLSAYSQENWKGISEKVAAMPNGQSSRPSRVSAADASFEMPAAKGKNMPAWKSADRRFSRSL